MLVTNDFIRLLATIYAIETYLNSKTTLIIETRNAIIFTLKLKIVALYFLIKLLRSTMLILLAKVQCTILSSIDQIY